MRRLRMMVPVVLLAVGAGLVSGCQQQPGTAAYVGAVRLADSEVEDAVTRIEADLSRTGQQLPAEAYGNVRRAVVQLHVFNGLARRYAQEKGYPPPTVDYPSIAAQTGLPVDDPYVRLVGEAEAYRQLLLTKAAPVDPTEEELREAYRRIQVASGGQTAPYEEIKPLLEQSAEFRAGVGLRRELVAAAARYGVGVNPRYTPVEVPLTVVPNGASQLTLVALPLGEPANDAVRDT